MIAVNSFWKEFEAGKKKNNRHPELIKGLSRGQISLSDKRDRIEPRAYEVGGVPVWILSAHFQHTFDILSAPVQHPSVLASRYGINVQLDKPPGRDRR